MAGLRRFIAPIADSSIRSRLFATLVLAAFLPLAFGLSRALSVYEDWASAELYGELEEQFRLFDLMIDRAESDLLEHLSEFAADADTSRALSSGDPASLLTPAISLVVAEGLHDFFVVSADEAIFLDAVGTASQVHGIKGDLQLGLALSHTPAVDLDISPEGDVGLAVAVPIYDVASSRLLGAVFAYQEISAAWLEAPREISGFDFTLASKARLVRASTWLTNGGGVPAFNPAGRPGQPDEVTIDGHPHIGLERPILDAMGLARGRLVISRPEGALETARAEINRQILLTAVVTFLVVTLISWRLTRSIGGGLARLKTASRAIGAGNYDVDPGIHSKDEIGQVAEAFRTMADRIRTTTAGQEEALEEVEVLNHNLEETVAKRTSELRNAQARLVRRERLAVLGQLAGSVSHEIRNPLGSIRNAVYYLRMTQKLSDPKADEYLDLIDGEVSNANRIVGELLDFASQAEPNHRPIVLQSLLEQALEKEAGTRAAGIDHQVHLGEDPLTLQAEPDQLMRAFANLIRNAYQSMGESGTLTIKCTRREATAVTIIQDTGVGVAPENLDEIFEPLFTNKTKGVGLGLPLAKRYIESCGGSIGCSSELGQGTRFEIVIPTIQKEGNEDD